MSDKFDRTPDDNLAEWDAAYVLGALSLAERRTYEDYLAANPARAAELTDLAEMPAILDALSRDEAAALIDLDNAPAADVASLAQAAAKRQRRSRRSMLAATIAVAAALAVVGGVVGATVFPRTSSVQTVAMEPMQPGQRQGLTAQLAVTEKKWGTELNWACEYTKDWARDVDSYDIVVTTRDGVQTAVGSWRPAGDEATGLSAATSIPTAEIRSIDIRVSGSDEPLAVRTL
ncbi:hypothetical protein ABQF33_03215 [Mycolicibacterium sp. XJ2]